MRTEIYELLQNMTFKDKLISSDPFFSLVVMISAMILGLVIFLVYKKTFIGINYSRTFNVSLVAISVITCFIIIAVTSSALLSLGMVGALTIVRFRTSIRDPIDIVYLFWSIAVGIVCGAGMLVLAAMGTVVISIFLIIFSRRSGFDRPYILILNCADEEIEKAAVMEVRKEVKRFQIKSKTVTQNGIELALEIRIKGNETSFVNQLNNVEGISNVMIVSYNGDFA